jgi:predicted P-loop ATPase
VRRADVEHLKANLSRQVDRARMAYGRLSKAAPRQCVFFGTTNAEEYLFDPTGNRRIWPVRVVRFDVAAIKRDRDQLWAEAAAREKAGASIRLDPRLWGAAGEEQSERLTTDPYFTKLQLKIGDIKRGQGWGEC